MLDFNLVIFTVSKRLIRSLQDKIQKKKQKRKFLTKKELTARLIENHRKNVTEM